MHRDRSREPAWLRVMDAELDPRCSILTRVNRRMTLTRSHGHYFKSHRTLVPFSSCGFWLFERAQESRLTNIVSLFILNQHYRNKLIHTF